MSWIIHCWLVFMRRNSSLESLITFESSPSTSESNRTSSRLWTKADYRQLSHRMFTRPDSLKPWIDISWAYQIDGKDCQRNSFCVIIEMFFVFNFKKN